MTQTRIRSTSCTHIGRRAKNEDSVVANPAIGLFAVADGMGGRAGGEVASRLAISAIANLIQRIVDDPLATWPRGFDAALTFEEGLADTAVRQANQAIFEHRVGKLSEMGSTLAMLLLRDDLAVIAHVGDSRVYRLRDGTLTQLTRDHSLYDDLLAAGARNLPPRRRFPYSNVITRVLGDPSKSLPDLRTEQVRDGDVFLLCSDGLTETMPPQRIRFVLSSYPPAEAGRRLVREAFLRGATDNISAVVVQVGASETPTASVDHGGQYASLAS